MTEQELRQKLQEVRALQPWAANYDDAILLHTIKKYPALFADMGPIPWFEWGVDPITKTITKVAEVAVPNIMLLLAIAIGVFLFLKAK